MRKIHQSSLFHLLLGRGLDSFKTQPSDWLGLYPASSHLNSSVVLSMWLRVEGRNGISQFRQSFSTFVLRWGLSRGLEVSGAATLAATELQGSSCLHLSRAGKKEGGREGEIE